jgi:hypothetical protein
VGTTFRIAPLVAAALLAAGCSTVRDLIDSPSGAAPSASGSGADASGGNVSTEQAFLALNAGDYAKARDLLVPLQAANPHDPYLELNLAVAYENLGHMDLAEPLYRSVLVDGRGVMPGDTTNPADANKSLAGIACTNLMHGLKKGPDAQAAKPDADKLTPEQYADLFNNAYQPIC